MPEYKVTWVIDVDAVVPERTVRAQREFMAHIRNCPECDGRGKRCEVAQAMAQAIIGIAKAESREEVKP